MALGEDRGAYVVPRKQRVSKSDVGGFFAICYLLFAILVPKVLQRWSI
jgi:hypothetical protein